MSEPVAKERPTVDLDDFERRLRHQDHYHEDPLAELARLVGESHDPYGDVFAQPEPASHRLSYQQQAQPRHEPDFAPRDVSPRLSGDFAAIEAGLRGSLSAHPDDRQAPQHAEHEFYAQQDLYAQQDHYAHQDLYAHQDPQDNAQHQQWAEAPPARTKTSGSRRPIYAMVATIAVGVIGVGVAFAYKGASSSPSEIRTITAAAGPTKIQPPADASSDASVKDASILSNGSQTPTRLVSAAEQPVDVSQAVQENGSRNPDAGPSPGDAANVPVPLSPTQASGEGANPPAASSSDSLPTFGMADMPAPKKVKVVSVRPDGTILPTEPMIGDSAAAPTIPAAGDDPIARAADPNAAAPKTTSRAAPKTMKVARADSSDGDAAPPPKTTRKAKPQRLAAAEQTTPDAQPTGSVPDRANGGGFAVQLAAPGSEADARSVSSRLAKKFAGALDGHRLGFHRAQSNGKSVFRVRVVSLSREDAVSLCEKLKADGGSCFVAKNN